jgi:tetratricopeptide (TPR) repeat protein
MMADLLSSLVDKSLVNVSLSEATARYAMLDSVRSFAFERLTEARQVALFSQRHAEWVAAFADWVDSTREGTPEQRLRAEVDPELENARAALTWSLDMKSEEGGLLAGRIVGGLRTIWLTSGRRSECRRWAEAVLELIDEERYPRVVAPILRALVQIAVGIEVLEWAKRAMSVFERIGDRVGIGLLQSTLANEYRRRGMLDEADAAITRAEQMLASPNLPRLMPYSVFLRCRAMVRLDQGRYDEALADSIEEVAFVKALGDEDMPQLSSLRAEVEFAMGNRETAIETMEDVIGRALPHTTRFHEIDAYNTLAFFRVVSGDIEAGYVAGREGLLRARSRSFDDLLMESIGVMALIATARGKVPVAARLWGALNVRLRRSTAPHTIAAGMSDTRVRQLLVESLERQLPPQDLQKLTAEGSLFTIDVAIAEALKI